MTHYERLGVDRVASLAEIKTAFRRRVRDFHPDLFQSYKDKASATLKTRELLESYRVLRDPSLRALYEASLGPPVGIPRSVPRTEPSSTSGTKPLYESPLFREEKDFSRDQFVWSTLKVAFWAPVMVLLSVALLRGLLVESPTRDADTSVSIAVWAFAVLFPLGAWIALADLRYRVKFILAVLRLRRDYAGVLVELRLNAAGGKGETGAA
ncbi:MAG: J domain-containing protein [Thermoanaerobaculia bacterium]